MRVDVQARMLCSFCETSQATGFVALSNDRFGVEVDRVPFTLEVPSAFELVSAPPGWLWFGQAAPFAWGATTSAALEHLLVCQRCLKEGLAGRSKPDVYSEWDPRWFYLGKPGDSGQLLVFATGEGDHLLATVGKKVKGTWQVFVFAKQCWLPLPPSVLVFPRLVVDSGHIQAA